MKNVKIGLLCAAILFGMNANSSPTTHETAITSIGDSETETFKVYGNCGMCEKTIEGSLKDVNGIEKADWNKETKMIEVVYHTHDISLDEIKKKIADVGYDTEEYRASEKVYNNLPGCCQYERPEAKEEDHSDHNH